MRKDKVLDALSLISRFALAFVWISAGISKISDRLDTMQSIEGYDIFSPTWVDWIATVIGPLELIGGVMLLAGIFLRQAGKISAVVLVLFIIGIAQAWARGLNIDCGCFGAAAPSEAHMDYLLTILRDVVFIAMSMMCVYWPYRRFALHV
ncbi:DoxX family protein [Corynebacterium gerontici]|uniref:Methylamine utilization protein MauE n=1 Tax=Corynebacterium gerontici TaxID=2079234 RepID=A0A3G6IYC1_9CORY|nr:DoxX family protein [Corynebacterium gerontici]AZA10769.1 Methylamine utilization protein MauE [Corynebacterium gerontici]